MDADLALTLSAYWACVSGISDDIAAMPWRVFERTAGGGRADRADHPVAWLLDAQANPEMTAFEFRQVMFVHALTHGNGIAEIERDAGGRPVWLWPVEPWRVCLRRDAAGLYYEVQNYGRPAAALDPADVIHVKGLGDGLWGYSVIQYAAQQLGLAVTTERHAGRLFANDGRPGLWVEKKGRMDEPARKRYKEDFRRSHAKNPNDIAVMTGGDVLHQFDQVSPQDAQLIESRKFDGESICRWFKYPQHKAGFLDRSTNNNIEHQGLEYVTSCLAPWAVRAEQQANLKLFGQKQRGSFFTRMNFNSLMRGDAESRSKFYSTMVNCGAMSLDEPREMEDLNPLPEGLGKEHFIQKAMQTVDQAVNPPAPPAPAPAAPPAGDAPAGQETEPAAEDTPADTAAALRPVFRDAAGRVVRREAHRAADALKRLSADPDGLATWRAGFLAEHRAYVAKAFAPAALALGCPADAAGLVLDLEAVAACGAFTQAAAPLTGEPDPAALAAEWEAARADGLADRVMKNLTLAARVYGSP